MDEFFSVRATSQRFFSTSVWGGDMSTVRRAGAQVKLTTPRKSLSESQEPPRQKTRIDPNPLIRSPQRPLAAQVLRQPLKQDRAAS